MTIEGDVKSCLCSIPVLLVEIIFFLYKTGESMLDATTRPYIVKVVCHTKFGGNDSVCGELNNYPEIEDDIQTEAGLYLMYYRIIVNLPAIFLGLFCGAWSDKYGRKVPMILPSLGSVFSVLLYMCSLASEDWTIGWIMVGAFVQGIFGKSSVITMAVNSYASDITDRQDRTQKLGKLLAMNFFGLFAGALLSGIFQDMSDLPATLCMVVFIHGAAIMITVVFMTETVPLPSDRPEAFEGKGPFMLGNVKDSLSVLIKRRANKGRALILILFLASIVNQTCKVGETDITLLFVTRSPLSWPKSWYGYLLSVDYAVMGVCLFILLPILSNILKFPDVAIIIIGILCKITRLIWAGFCSETWMVYTSVVIGSFAGLLMSSVRSLMSKTVEEDELGKTFSLLASGETASKLLGAVIFVSIYSTTAYFFPGFAYMVEAFLYLLMLLIIGCLYADFKTIGQYDMSEAFTGRKMLGTHVYRRGEPVATRKIPLRVVDEIEEEPLVPQPVPATTP